MQPGLRTAALITCAALGLAALAPSEAHACGLSPPVGSTGICYGDEAPAAVAPNRFAIRASYGAFGSDVTFGDLDGFIERRAVAASLEYRASPDLTLQLSGGMGYSGRLIVDDLYHDMLPGWLAAFSASYRILEARNEGPFVLLSATLGASGAHTRQLGEEETVAFNAFDLRVSATAGKTFLDVLSAYVSVRAFGGPILWQYRGEDVTGSDQHHYQIAMGIAVSLPSDIDVFAEGAPFGERAATVGAGFSF